MGGLCGHRIAQRRVLCGGAPTSWGFKRCRDGRFAAVARTKGIVMVAQIDRQMILRRPWKIPGRLIAYALIEGRALTTRGRWINPLVFAGYRLAQILPAPVRSQPPVFIIGTGRSGTTVLGKIFAMHRNAVFLNEPKALWHFAHGGEDIIGSYTSGPARITLGPAPNGPAIARKIRRVYNWALFWGMGRRIVDKYPELIFRIPFVLDLFHRARFVAILRDGVDTCASVTGWSQANAVHHIGQTHDWWGRDDRKWKLIVDQLVPNDPDLAPLAAVLAPAQDHRDRAAVEWILSMRAAQKAQTEYPDAVLCIRYESLCATPGPVLEAVLAHCGFRDDPVFDAYAAGVLTPARADKKPLVLMPDLVAPFKKALVDLGYENSQSRVEGRTPGSADQTPRLRRIAKDKAPKMAPSA